MKLTRTYEEIRMARQQRLKARCGIRRRFARLPTQMTNGSIIWLEEYQEDVSMFNDKTLHRRRTAFSQCTRLDNE